MTDQGSHSRLMQGEVLEFSSSVSGDTVLCIGGTHGNERTGIEVVAELCERLSTGRYVVEKGSVVLAIGNPKAVAMNARLSDVSRDLNKSFTDTYLHHSEDVSYESQRARTLAKHIESAEIVIDIHSTQRPTAQPFISAKIDTRHEEVYRWFNPPIHTVLQDPNYIFAGELASIDEYADKCGAVGICLESGFAEASSADMVLSSIENLLISRGLLQGEISMSPQVPMQRFEWVESVPYDPKDTWEWSQDITVRSFEHIPAGTVFGYINGQPVSRDFDAYLLFPKTDEMRVLEKRITYLAKRID